VSLPFSWLSKAFARSSVQLDSISVDRHRPQPLHSLYFILGPTASGKSALALDLALRCNAEIIGADAFQVYQGLDLLTAKPSKSDRELVPHHLVDEIPLNASFNVGQFSTMANERIEQIRSRNKPTLIVGGTGLYIRALTHGLANLPPADPVLRTQLETLSLAQLQSQLRSLDPISLQQIDQLNPRRLIRALEVSILTGKPFSSFRQQWQLPTSAKGIILNLPREELYMRINQRTNSMFDHGVEEEVRGTSEVGATANQAIGLNEIRALLQGKLTKSQCIERIQTTTRQYAKRQMTWFRREFSFQTVSLTNQTNRDHLADSISKEITRHTSQETDTNTRHSNLQ
jgi:tRNA dimethylallyltransferase